MVKHRYKSQKKFFNVSNILRFVVIFLIIVVIFNFVNMKNTKNINFKTSKKQITDVIAKLEKKYQAEVDISSCNGVVKGTMHRDGVVVDFDVIDPVLLTDMKISYLQDGVNVKYKDIESKTHDNYLMAKFPLSMVIEIENMVYGNCFERWDIKNDILSIEGKYHSDDFLFKADLRKNRVIFIGQENNNLFANYK